MRILVKHIMKLIRKLLSKKLLSKQSKVISLEDKIHALENQSQSLREAIVMRDTSDADELLLKEAALQRLPYCPAIIHSVSGGVSVLEKVARIRLAELIDTKELDISLLQQDLDSIDILLDITSYVRDDNVQSAILDSILNSITDQKILADICASSQSTSVRKLLAGHISDIELLPTLSKILKSRDKVAYKIIKEKLNKVKEKNMVVADAEQDIAVLCDEMEFHSIHVYDKVYASRLYRLLQRWSEFETIEGSISDNNRRRFTEAKKVCERRVQAQEENKRSEIERNKKLSTAHDDRQLLLEKLWLQINKIYGVSEIDSSIVAALQEEKQALLLNWDELSHYGAVPERQGKLYASLCEAIESLSVLLFENKIESGTERVIENSAKSDTESSALSQVFDRIKNVESESDIDLNDINWLRQSLDIVKPITDFSAGEYLARYREILTEFDQKAKQKKEFEAKQSRIILSLIGQSHQAVEAGKVKKALGIRHSINEKLALLPRLPNKITLLLDSLDAAIQKLLDWQAYAVVPKKEALVTAMQGLVGIDLPPEALAIKIKALQDDWQELRQSGKNQDEGLWERFSQLADNAYAPCKIHYQGLADERQQNLEKRKVVVQQLNDYLRDNDWDNADWKQVEKVVQAARKEFYAYAPVERKTNKTIVLDFDSVMHTVQEKLNEEYNKNKNVKAHLIQQAQALADSNDVDQAISDAKHLQSQWKNAGRCAYKEDRKLWSEFRQYCDAAFAKKASIAAAHENERQSNFISAQALIAKLDVYLALSGDEFLAVRGACQEDREAWSKLGELPSHAKNKISGDFSRKLEQFEKKVSVAQRQIDQQAWQDFFAVAEKINHCQRNALSLGESVSGEDAADVFHAVSIDIEQTKRCPEGGRDTLNNKIQLALKNKSFDENANIELLKLLCIRAEITSDTASPNSDKQLRMGNQVSLLQQGFGSTLQANNAPGVIGLEWAVIGPVGADTYQKLFERFYTAWEKLQ
jgi:hypothetical protein